MNTFVEFLKEINKIETSYMFGPFKFTAQTIRRANGLQKIGKHHFVEYTRGTWSGEKW